MWVCDFPSFFASSPDWWLSAKQSSPEARPAGYP